MSDPQALLVTRNVIPGKLGVDLHLHRVHIPLVLCYVLLIKLTYRPILKLGWARLQSCVLSYIIMLIIGSWSPDQSTAWRLPSSFMQIYDEKRRSRRGLWQLAVSWLRLDGDISWFDMAVHWYSTYVYICWARLMHMFQISVTTVLHSSTSSTDADIRRGNW